MDVFLRTFLPATSQAGIPMSTISRHMPILRRCVESDDATALIARAHRPDRPLTSDFLLLLTFRRFVVTQESRVLHRLRLHLNTELRLLSNVTWHPDPHLKAIELAATAVDGIRERFWIHTRHSKQVWHLDALFSHLFRPRAVTPGSQPGTAEPGRYVGFADHLVRV
jgi:hypothetical protein